jgi:hypothetical protein
LFFSESEFVSPAPPKDFPQKEHTAQNQNIAYYWQ